MKQKELANRPPMTDDEGEVRELQDYDVPFFRPFSELPAELQQKLLSLKRPERKPNLQVELAPDVVEPFLLQGDDWQQRIEGVLREWLRQHAA